MNRHGPWLAGGLLLVAALVLLRQFPLFDGTERQAVRDRRAVLRMLAENLPPEAASGCVLVLSNPFAASAGGSIQAFEQAGIEGLREGFPPECRLEVVHPDIRPEFRDDPRSARYPSDTSTPLSYLMDASSLDRIAGEHPDCMLMVSLIGLPVGIERREVWRNGGAVRFALLEPDLRMLGGSARVADAFRSGRIVAAAVSDPEGETLIVDSENVDALLAERPGLLGLKERGR